MQPIQGKLTLTGQYGFSGLSSCWYSKGSTASCRTMNKIRLSHAGSLPGMLRVNHTIHTFTVLLVYMEWVGNVQANTAVGLLQDVVNASNHRLQQKHTGHTKNTRKDLGCQLMSH